MRKVIHKWFLDWEKEEKWINEMAAKGLALTSIGLGRFEFEECDPGEYKYRCELLPELPNHPESEQYIRFVESTGAEHVTSWMRWVYFRKKASEGEFELFSDNASKIKHLSAVLALIGVIAGLNLFVGAYNITLALVFSSPVNFMGLGNIALGAFLTALFIRYFRRRQRLKGEKTLFE